MSAHPPDIRRRLKAARELAGLTVQELAERIDSERLGAKALGSLERGDRKTPPQPHELAAIAAACGLPYEFFTVDFSRLSELTELTEVGGGSTMSLPDFIAKQQSDFEAMKDMIEQKIEGMAAELEVLRVRGAIDPADHTEDLTRAIEDEAPPRDESESADRDSEQLSDATGESPGQAHARGTRPA